MSFIWLPMLLSLALIPVGAWLYVALGRRRRQAAATYGGLGLTVTGRPLRWRAWIPAALWLGGFVLMCIALARPQGTVSLPSQEGTVILAFDVSGSMAADDLKPTRLDAEKAASQAFVQAQPAGVDIGVVAFSGAGLSVQVPTSDQGAVLAAIDRLTPQNGTSLGQGILASLNAITVAEAGPNVDYYTNRSPAPTTSPAPVPPGSHTSAVIVLLSDGENNATPDPIAAAQAAADQGVRIDTIGIGTAAGTDLEIGGFSVHTQLDEALLQQVSQMTGGTYYDATDAAGLSAIYGTIHAALLITPQVIELTALFAGASLVLFVAGGLASLAWLGRLP